MVSKLSLGNRLPTPAKRPDPRWTHSSYISKQCTASDSDIFSPCDEAIKAAGHCACCDCDFDPVTLWNTFGSIPLSPDIRGKVLKSQECHTYIFKILLKKRGYNIQTQGGFYWIGKKKQ